MDIGPSPLWVEVRPLEVLVRHADGSFAKSFAEKGELVPLQLALRRSPMRRSKREGLRRNIAAVKRNAGARS